MIDTTIVEIKLEEGTTCESALKSIQDGYLMSGGFIKCDGVIVPHTRVLVPDNIYDYTDGVHMDNDTIISQLNAVRSQLQIMSPILFRMHTEILNPWLSRDVTHNRSSAEFRSGLKAALNIPTPFIPCMITTMMGNADQVVAAHILPTSTPDTVLHALRVSKEDLETNRNALFLALNVKKCFDSLKLSFIPVDRGTPSANYKLHIWDNSIRELAIWDGHKNRIGNYDGHYVNMSGHQPIERALAYQAHMAYLNTVLRDKETLVSPLPADVNAFLERRKEFDDLCTKIMNSECGV